MRILCVHQPCASRTDVGRGRANDFARALVAAGHEVVVLAGTLDYLRGGVVPEAKGRLFSRETIDGYQVLRTWTYDGYHRSYAHRVVSFLTYMVSSLIGGMLLRRVDVVVACTPPFFTGVSGYLLSLRHRATYVYELRDLWSEVAFQLGMVKNGAVVALVRKLERFLYGRARAMVINTPGFLEPLVRAGVSRERIHLVPNGIDIELFRPMPEARERLRAEQGVNGQFVAMYAGSLGKANDIDTILAAADLLRGDPDVVFWLLGDGKDRPRLEARARELRLTNVRFLGSQPKQRVPEYIAACDAGVATLLDIPLFRTVYPNKVFDYMGGARPTVLAIDGVIHDVMDAARGGVFVAPQQARALADGVLALKRDPAGARAMGDRARRYVEEHFDRRTVMRQMCAVLEQLA